MGGENEVPVSMPETKYPMDARTDERLANDYVYHAPLPDQLPRYQHLRDEARALAYEFVRLCPPSRELSCALTQLDQAVFYANAAIARNEK